MNRKTYQPYETRIRDKPKLKPSRIVLVYKSWLRFSYASNSFCYCLPLDRVVKNTR